MPGRTINRIHEGRSRKRSRGRLPDDDGSDSTSDRPRNGMDRSQNGVKRARVSDIEAHDLRQRTPSSSSADDEETSGPEDDRVGSPANITYENMRDKNFEHLTHEEEDDLRATQLLRFRPNRLGDNQISDNGIIERITCVNFMCHERLTCDLGPLLNFIVGENGSGKSAILTAITICLGGKASSTNRGGSLKSFIKEGRDRAVLAVQIKNQGQGAYRPDVYGDAIVVERHFTKAGQSGFKVKSATNRIISTKKAEVDEIVEYFCLQVDNPLNVLSQDNARQFLNSSSAAQKYKFFIEGVQLQQLDNDYRLIAESLEQNESKVPEQEERVKLAKRECEEAQRLKEIYESNEQLRLQHRNLGNQLAWSQVDEQEHELELREKYVTETATRIAEAHASVQEKEETLASGEDAIGRCERNIQDAKDAESDHRLKTEEAGEVAQEKGRELQALHVDERDAHSAARAEKVNVKELEQKIAEEQQRLEEATGDAPIRKREELEAAKTRLGQMEEQSAKLRGQDPDQQAKIKQAKDNLARIMDAKQKKAEEIRQAKAAIARLEESRSSVYAAYEPKVPTLIKNIAGEKRFQSQPVGPIGAHVHLLKPEWSSILEGFLGKNLNAFVVGSVHDQKILANMMRQLGIRNCPVMIGGQLPLDLRGKEPDEQFDTILRVLKFDNDMVRNQLIINSAVEQVILVPKRADAQEIMFRGPPPSNVKACLCNHDSKRGHGLRLTNNRGNISTQPVDPRLNAAPRMKADSMSQVAFLRDSIRQLENEFAEIESDRQIRYQQHQACIRDWDKHKKEQDVLKRHMNKCEVEISHKAAELDQFDGVDGRLRGLQEQLEEAKRKAEHFAHQYAEIRVKKELKKEDLDQAKDDFRQLGLELKDLEARTAKAETKLKQVQGGYQITLTELNEAFAMVQQAKATHDRAQEKRDRQAARVQDYTHEAEKCHSVRLRIPEGETSESLHKRHLALEKRINEQRKKHGMSEQQILERYKDSWQTYHRKARDLKSIRRVNQSFKQALNERLVKWRLFQRNIGAHSRANFRLLLSERGFRGRLVIDHGLRTLDIQVEPDRTEKIAGGRSTKTLSGGEKSFSSICLLLSIWEAMGSPLRCLDEFDVFMDNVNRAISTNMLIDTARRSVNRQYIFITPNAIEGGKQYDKDVKIIRLSDPRQRTLTLT
ncbi:P-loop containing nucleoside triphosphate hydrolase protein [Thozetella sp. PMI_491]|nr:P-loop containing nucleoside triphosphate hydrolase protein [Thozetella sp. PMI_491]